MTREGNGERKKILIDFVEIRSATMRLTGTRMQSFSETKNRIKKRKRIMCRS